MEGSLAVPDRCVPMIERGARGGAIVFLYRESAGCYRVCALLLLSPLVPPPGWFLLHRFIVRLLARARPTYGDGGREVSAFWSCDVCSLQRDFLLEVRE